MAQGNKTYHTNNRSSVENVRHWTTFFSTENLATGVVQDFIIKLPFRGKLNDVQFALGVKGAGGTSIDVDVLDDGVSVLTTKPAIAPTAADEDIISVGGSGTGLTAPVIDSTKATVAEDSKVKVVVTVNGTYATAAENATVVLEWIEQQDFDPAA